MIDLGHGLRQVQLNVEPPNFRAMRTIGPGVYELKAVDVGPQSQDFRVVYIAKFEEAVYVLHAFEKRTQATSGRHIALAKRNYRAVIARRNALRSRGKGRT